MANLYQNFQDPKFLKKYKTLKKAMLIAWIYNAKLYRVTTLKPNSNLKQCTDFYVSKIEMKDFPQLKIHQYLEEMTIIEQQ